MFGEIFRYDTRGFVSDLVMGGDEEALPPTRSQDRRWTRVFRPAPLNGFETPPVLSSRGTSTRSELSDASEPGPSSSASPTIRFSNRSGPCDRRSASTSERARLDRRAPFRSGRRVRRRRGSARPRIPGSLASRHAGGVNLPGEGDLDACLLPSGSWSNVSDGRGTGTISSASTTPGLRHGR